MIILAGVLVHRAMRPLRNRCVAVFRVVVAALILVGTYLMCVDSTDLFSKAAGVIHRATRPLPCFLWLWLVGGELGTLRGFNCAQPSCAFS